MRTLTIVAVAAFLPPAAAVAQTAGRFTFQPMDGGLMRLDTETGQVSHCTKTGESYACRSVADDRAALQEEIDRLRSENEALRAGRGPSVSGRLQLPSEEEIDKAVGLFEKMMRRVLRTFREDGQGEGRL